MKIILSNNFIIDFNKEFKKYWVNHLNLISKLKETKMINLKNPYVKIKTYINKISIRWIWIINDKWTLIPVYFVLKSNKKDWENLILDKATLNKINTIFWKYSLDFNNMNYKEF